MNNFKNAIQWVSNKNADPFSMLSALTFIYIANKGYSDFSSSEIKIADTKQKQDIEKRRETWGMISTIVKQDLP